LNQWNFVLLTQLVLCNKKLNTLKNNDKENITCWLNQKNCMAKAYCNENTITITTLIITNFDKRCHKTENKITMPLFHK